MAQKPVSFTSYGTTLTEFSKTEIIYSEADRIIEDTYLEESAEIKIEIKEDLGIWLNGSKIAVTSLAENLIKILPPEGIGATVPISVSPDIEVPTDLIKQLQGQLGALGVRKIDLNGLIVVIRDKAEPDRKHNQDKATPKMVAEYNALAKKYNSMPRDNFRVIAGEVERMHYIYDLMTEDQRKNAEPFPEIPEPPQPPQPAVDPTPPTAGEIVETLPATAVATVVTPTPPSPEAPVKAVLADKPAMDETQVAPTLAEVVELPPPPPPPKSPIEFVEEMAKKDAEFYYNGKKISAAKAIEILESSDKISLRAKHTGLKRPIVELSDEPFEIKED